MRRSPSALARSLRSGRATVVRRLRSCARAWRRRKRPVPRFVGPILYGLLGLIETEPSAREAALAAGEALLVQGSGGHNHMGFRRYAIEAALQAKEWDAAEVHADALARRTAAEPLPYSDLIIERGHILARMGRGTPRDEDLGELTALRAKAAAVDFRIDALRDALRAG